MAEFQTQDKELIYALDIGTRGVVGILGKKVGDRLCVQDVEFAEHTSRTMVDGQIDDIKQVAKLVRNVTDRLQDRLGIRLERVYLAAAGRALRTEKGSFSLELTENSTITPEDISQLETGAVSKAEEILQNDESSQKQFFLIGYTVAQYRLDGYVLSTLQDHSGKLLEADVVATFLPGEVVESLYTATKMAELQVAGITLEPIAAMNAAIPAEIRLLNLALVDIGAGTTDIAVCRDGSVVGYTMTTVAGDEITETVMRHYLVDFQTAETMKRSLVCGKDIEYVDILGLENVCTCEEFRSVIQDSTELLADEIANQVVTLNGAPPSALFLAGGGSKLEGLQQLVAEKLKMDSRRVAVAGSNYAKSAYSETIDLNTPELATPLGIAVSACLGLINDSYVVHLNGKPAKLFRSGVLNVRDILLMNGFTYSEMLAKNGKTLRIVVDGEKRILHGEVGTPASLLLNGQETSLTQIVHAGDSISFVPAAAGKDASCMVSELYRDGISRSYFVNEQEVPQDYEVQQGDEIISFVQASPPAAKILKSEPKPTENRAELQEQKENPVKRPTAIAVDLNGRTIRLDAKPDGMPYYLMDLLERTDIDFQHLDRPVRLEVNGSKGEFSQVLKNGDTVIICCEN